MHVMSQILNFLYSPIPGRERLQLQVTNRVEVNQGLDAEHSLPDRLSCLTQEMLRIVRQMLVNPRQSRRIIVTKQNPDSQSIEPGLQSGRRP